jgi:hypothetical protein
MSPTNTYARARDRLFVLVFFGKMTPLCQGFQNRAVALILLTRMNTRHHMIRASCSWLLIALALSPLTTCDVNSLLKGRVSTMLVAWGRDTADLMATSSIDDPAERSSPLGRAVLSRDSVLDLMGWRIRPLFDAPVRPRPVPVLDNRSFQDLPLQSLVLRL